MGSLQLLIAVGLLAAETRGQFGGFGNIPTNNGGNLDDLLNDPAVANEIDRSAPCIKCAQDNGIDLNNPESADCEYFDFNERFCKIKASIKCMKPISNCQGHMRRFEQQKQDKKCEEVVETVKKAAPCVKCVSDNPIDSKDDKIYCRNLDKLLRCLISVGGCAREEREKYDGLLKQRCKKSPGEGQSARGHTNTASTVLTILSPLLAVASFTLA